jgi:hypothetical protein
VTLAERQLEMLRRMAALDPPPWFMGGYAKEALLAGAVTRPHEDFDWLLTRGELELRLEQAGELGFSDWSTIGEAAPVELDGIAIRVASPLALCQMEVAIAARGSFGELSARHRETTRRLRERFLPDLDEAALEPHVERLQ